MRISEVKSRTGLSNSTIYANIKKGIFPKPPKPSPGVSAWRESEIIAIINGNWHG
jgi:predicted DNA-binding transcriptional regulator AlpA